MKKAAELFLGILTAMGGFVEIGELTFTLGAGVHLGYQLLWVTVLGTGGIMVYCEMAGRIAAIQRRPVFSLIRERNGFGAALLTLVAANAVNLLTCAAEVGGVALLWQLMTGWPYRALLFAALAFFVVVVWLLPFQWIERVFGLGGLLMWSSSSCCGRCSRSGARWRLAWCRACRAWRARASCCCGRTWASR